MKRAVNIRLEESISILNNYILVTNNIKHFERIKNLKIEKWVGK